MLPLAEETWAPMLTLAVEASPVSPACSRMLPLMPVLRMEPVTVMLPLSVTRLMSPLVPDTVMALPVKAVRSRTNKPPLRVTVAANAATCVWSASPLAPMPAPAISVITALSPSKLMSLAIWAALSPSVIAPAVAVRLMAPTVLPARIWLSTIFPVVVL